MSTKRCVWLNYLGQHLLVAVSLLLCWGTLVWIGGDRLASKRINVLVEGQNVLTNEHADALSYNLHHSLAFLRALPIYISSDDSVVSVVSTHGSASVDYPTDIDTKAKAAVFLARPALTVLSRQLAREASQFGVDIAWIINDVGDCIAASNFERPEKLIGTNYRDRDYFKMPMKGQLGHQFAVGRNTNIPGIYFSAPIMSEGRARGAAVIKIDLAKLSPLLGSADSFVTDEYGVIIMARRPSLWMRVLPENRLAELSPDAREFRYKQRDFLPLNITPWDTLRTTQMFHFEGSFYPYLMTTRAETEEGMTVHVVNQLDELGEIEKGIHQLKVAIFIAGASLLLLMGGIIMHLRRSSRYVKELREKQASLEIEKQRAEAATEAKAQFLANMSHEIRTPMSGVIGLGQLALKTCQDNKQRDYLQKILSSATSLLNIINNILDFSRIESGKLTIESINFNIKSVLDSAANVTAIRASEKHLELIFHVDSNVPSHLIGDPFRLGQILLNLINNAIKFTERGEVVLSITVSEWRESNVEISFSVRDTGIGLTPEQQSRLFQSFSQADTSTTRRFGGTGLGLTISKRIAELMGGRIEVKSEAGVGSTFSFTAIFGLREQINEKVLTPTDLHFSLRVLIVDDNATAREILSSMLISCSMQVQTATGGSEALSAIHNAAANHAPFDLILLDWQMPEPNGPMTATAIMESEKIEKKPKIIMISAYYRHDEVMVQADRLGIDAFLTKPVEQSLLIETITSIFSKNDLQLSVNQPVPVVQVPSGLRGTRVLLAEDNNINQQIAIEFLSEVGVHIDLVTNGKDAVAKILNGGNTRYDAILMDIQMPEMDGLEATRRIRKHLGATPLPIIAMTAHAMEIERKRCLAAGMDDHIAKPIVPAILFETLGRWITPREIDVPVELEPTKQLLESIPSHPTIEMTSQTDLPDSLPPFDIATAVARMLGKRDLVRKLLINFHKSFSDSPVLFDHMLTEGRFDELLRLSHTLKGVAATLEASALTKAAATLENTLLNGCTDDVRSLIETVKIELAPALLAASRVIAQPNVAPEFPLPSSITPLIINYSEANRLIAELQILLTKNSIKARKALAPLREILIGSNLDSHMNTLMAQLDRFDFRGAENTLAVLITNFPSQE